MKFSLSDKMSVGVSECDVVGRANEADFRGAFLPEGSPTQPQQLKTRTLWQNGNICGSQLAFGLQ